ncbi:MAG TPA: peptide chain release factor N(5)-glutamine methyltransferase [Actinomycetota bacterium]|nr:peptide chain release factor N(5)-glutamine methyltransferase [Actinomycetota bacterium]
MRPAEVVRRGAEYLARHDVDSPVVAAEQLMMSVLDTDRAGIYARAAGLSSAEARTYGRLLCRRCAGAPTQHLTGETGFRRLVLEVVPGVFVPRPETESLVDVALAVLDADPSEAPIVVDVGTGTGAVALAIADERPAARVIATDVSREAVTLARANAARLGLSVDVREGDLLSPLDTDVRGEVALVVSNPPYLDPSWADQLSREVLADPALALFGDLAGYERLFGAAAAWLRAGGGVAVEVDVRIAGDVADAAARAGFRDVTIQRDLAGRERVVAGRWP